MLNNIKVVLCNTSHSGNIGATARAMKTMGILNLVLVAPIAITNEHSLALASNAQDVVQNAQVVSTLKEALINTHLAIAMTARRREFSAQLQTPREISHEIIELCNNNQQVALVFGNESKGLSIEQQELCNRLVTIPGNPQYFSLNLAQAVQIICYEIYSSYNPNIDYLKTRQNKATVADIQGVLNHIDEILSSKNFYKHKNTTRVRRHLQQIIHKANLEREEVDLLRGILKSLI